MRSAKEVVAYEIQKACFYIFKIVDYYITRLCSHVERYLTRVGASLLTEKRIKRGWRCLSHRIPFYPTVRWMEGSTSMLLLSGRQFNHESRPEHQSALIMSIVARQVVCLKWDFTLSALSPGIRLYANTMTSNKEYVMLLKSKYVSHSNSEKNILCGGSQGFFQFTVHTSPTKELYLGVAAIWSGSGQAYFWPVDPTRVTLDSTRLTRQCKTAHIFLIQYPVISVSNWNKINFKVCWILLKSLKTESWYSCIEFSVKLI